MNFNSAEIEKIIGYTFKNKNLLQSCFTHRSYSHEKGGFDNERLEFLGDSVLGFVVADYLFKKKGRKDEGSMTVAKQNLVSKNPLSRAIKNVGLEQYIIFGDSVGNDRQNPAFCENLFEALVAGIYLDGGLQSAQKFIYDLLINANCEQSAKKTAQEIDYKSALQVKTQAKKMGTPKYELIKKTGADHAPLFTIGVVIEGKTVAVGQGKSKSEASKDAAKRALKKLTGRNA